jgi:hypothetical protein
MAHKGIEKLLTILYPWLVKHHREFIATLQDFIEECAAGRSKDAARLGASTLKRSLAGLGLPSSS